MKRILIASVLIIAACSKSPNQISGSYSGNISVDMHFENYENGTWVNVPILNSTATQTATIYESGGNAYIDYPGLPSDVQLKSGKASGSFVVPVQLSMGYVNGKLDYTFKVRENTLEVEAKLFASDTSTLGQTTVIQNFVSNQNGVLIKQG